ncbi:MAG: methyl-accepting chemotaxis protein, partial [Lachnospiraceae bacterium]|nr:methyl-accepting chemotaxis protein [Lachnospiraceae bacterium]
MKEGNGKKQGFRFSLVAKIATMAIAPIVILGVVLAIVGMNAIESGMEQEVLSGLDAEVQALEGAYDEVSEGDYTLDGENLMKGDYNVTENQGKLDEFVEGYDIAVTLIYGKTRRATTLVDDGTGERMTGTDVSEAVFDTVVGKGQKFSSNSVEIKGQRYYAVYHPMRNGDDKTGEVVGMYFAGRPAAGVDSYVRSKAMTMIIVAVLIAVAAIVFVAFSVLAIRKVLAKTGEILDQLSQGDLTMEAPEKLLRRNDELGDMARGIHDLMEQLKVVIGNVQEAVGVVNDAGKELSSMASQTSNTADEIGHAVEDISKGAVSQAEEIEML